MEHEERRRAEALDRYWDAVLQGGPPARPRDIDDVAAAVITHLGHEQNTASFSAARARTRQRLLAQTKVTEVPMSTPLPLDAAVSPSAHGGAAWPGPASLSPPRWSRSRLKSVPFVTMVFVTAVVVLGVVLLGPGRDNQERLALIPAADVGTPAAEMPVSATPAVMWDPVFTTTLPADQVPTAGNLDVVLWHAVLEAGQDAVFQADAVDCCPGPQLTHVIAGDLSLRVEGPVSLVRGGTLGAGAGGDVAAGTEVTLHPGDTAIYDFALPAVYANQGSAPLHLIGAGVLAGSMAWTPAGMTLLDGNETYSAAALPPGPAAVMLVRATLPPKATLPAPPDGSLILEAGATGDASIARGADGALRNIGPQAETIYVFTLSPVAVDRATPTP